MIVMGLGTDDTLELATPPGEHHARLFVEADGELVSTSLDANRLRVLAKLFEAAADELDRRAVS